MNQELRKVKTFVNKWKNGGREKQDTHKFWEELVECLLNVEHGRDMLDFEKKAPVPVVTTEDGTTCKYIDCYLKVSNCIIEQKSSTVSLEQRLEQSDTKSLNALEQAQRYYDRLARPERGKYTIACNFKEFQIKDQDKPDEAPKKLLLKDLPHRLRYLRMVLKGGIVDKNDELEGFAAKTASGIIKQLYELLKTQYTQKELNREVYHAMNVFCVRVVFCLYADDAGVFPNNEFQSFLETFDAKKLNEKFKWLFRRLNRVQADDALDDEIKAFPYVNGGLFREEVPIPKISDEVKKLLLASMDGLIMPGKQKTPFSWNQISPTNFGCIFESTLDPDTRRNNGMHYTSPENIHRVIDPLFLNGLYDEFAAILNSPKDEKNEKLKSFQRKIASLRFLDPACGSGNFLTETFKSLMRLELKVIKGMPNAGLEMSEIRNGDTYFKNPCLVNINKFYGIEINDFAVEVAKAALWISHCQMIEEAEEIFGVPFDPLPLSTNSNIHRKDALKVDWETIVPSNKLDYIIGNPPFEGSQIMDEEQKRSLKFAMCGKDETGKPIWKTPGKMDFVCAWYAKAAEYMKERPRIRAAYVSTNSITQGEQVGLLWKPLTEKFNAQILYAWKTFIWENESTDSANVHCVIIGFCCRKSQLTETCRIFNKDGSSFLCNRINAYLLPAEQLFIEAKRNHIQGKSVPAMSLGSMPNDTIKIEDSSSPTGKKTITLLRLSEEERSKLIRLHPELEPYLLRIQGSEDFISGEKNYCIWLDEDAPSDIRNHEALVERFNMVRAKRADSTREETRKLADVPYMFGEVRQPKEEYLLVPGTSSENRQYIPMDYVTSNVICSNAAYTISGCPKWMFGVLESKLHMAWVEIVCGRMKSDYRYSASIVYNNFPWPRLTESQKSTLEKSAIRLLQARKKELQGKTFEIIYSPQYIASAEYVEACKENDKAVFAAYEQMGITKDMSNEDIALALLRKSIRLAKKTKKKKRKSSRK